MFTERICPALLLLISLLHISSSAQMSNTALRSTPQVPTMPFKAQTIDSNIAIGYGIALGDVDGDTKPDILLADQKQFVWYRNGDWKRFVIAENLTNHDNVCIAARDINDDGKVEVAVGAQWNSGETANDKESGSVHVLVPPKDVTQVWKAVQLYHEPTIHRMQWLKASDNTFYLIVLPLHGRENKSGAGIGVRMLVYRYPDLLTVKEPYDTIQTAMHLTHNFQVLETKNFKRPLLGVAGREGIHFFQLDSGKIAKIQTPMFPMIENSSGEVRIGKLTTNKLFIATIEPMHGHEVVIYSEADNAQRLVIDGNVKEGHALAVADFLKWGSDQVVAGWRMPNNEGKVGIKMYSQKDAMGKQWTSQWIDDNGIACEDIQIMDLNGDGKLDIVASGRSTHNLKIYWNQSNN